MGANQSTQTAGTEQDLSAVAANTKCVEEALRDANQRLRAIIQTSPLAICACDPDGIVTLWNSAAQTTFGWTEQEALGRFLPFVTEESKAEARALRDAALAGESVVNRECVRHRRDGSPVVVSLWNAPLYDAAGKAIGVLVMAADMTERRQIEQQLRDQLRFIRELIEVIPNPIYFKGKDGRYLGFNRAWEKFFGTTREEWLGRTVYEIFPKALADKHQAEDEALYRSQRPQAYEITIPAGDGTERDTIYQKSIFTKQDGSVAGLIGVITDITERKRAETEILRAKERLKLALEGSNLALWDFDLSERNAYLSEGWSVILGEQPKETFTTLDQWITLVHPSDIGYLRKALGEALKGVTPELRAEHRVKTAEGDWKWILTQGKVVERDTTGKALRMTGTSADITERKAAADALRANEEKFRLITENVSDLIAMVDVDGRRVYNNPSYDALFGEGAVNPGSFSFDEIHPDDRERVWKIFQGTLTTGVGHQAQFRFLLQDGSVRFIESQGSVIRDSSGAISRLVIVSRDITERLTAEERMRYLAHYDLLTDLPNRALLQERVKQELIQAERNRKQLAVLFIDLDDFKKVNDSLGHPAGDELLRQVAQRLKRSLRVEDTVARQGGDEFIILIPNLEERSFIPTVTQKILDALSERFAINNHDVHIGASIGISVYPDDAIDAEPLLKNADTAMYHAKAEGKNNYQFFTVEMENVIRQRLSLENHLRLALERSQLVLHYQPQVDVLTARIVGVEALIRWNHPELGMLGPMQFIPYAEENGLIVAIGAWILSQACRENKGWQDAGYPPVRVAINVSGRQLRHYDFLRAVSSAIADTGLDPRYVELEITESVIMQHVDQTIASLDQLRKLGVQVAIDDFGTGYSSLSYLKRFDIDRLKIDRSFVRDITTDKNDAAIVSAILAMAKSLGIQVTAEGVETHDQLAFLRENACNQAQGYFFSKPLPEPEMARLLSTGAPLPLDPPPSTTVSQTSSLPLDGERGPL